MEEIGDALDRAAPRHFTQPLPKSAQARMRALVKAVKGDTAAAAARLGVSRRTCEVSAGCPEAVLLMCQ
ncbi:hypothetical protein [Kitasatospora purpeofusca]|uniref:hypothetical protein n=1 Tax=Kitasatospora purpeofusca TaxID=67352 RepID=UPI00386DD6CB